jgi:hypothetical protein
VKTQKITRQSYWKYIENIVTPKEEEPHSGMKKFWTYIKHKRKDNIGISSLMMDGKLFCDPASKSNILNRQFKSAFSANSKFTKKEFIKSKRMDPSIRSWITKQYERVIRKYQQFDQGIKSINRHIKLIIATIPPKDLIQTLLKYPHKSEKIETITRDHQTSYENFVCRINEEFINMFNNNETEVHIPLQS